MVVTIHTTYKTADKTFVEDTETTRLHQTLDFLDDSVWIINADWTLAYINKATEKLINRPAETIVGCNVFETFHPTPDVREAVERVKQTGVAETLRIDGEALGGWIHVAIHPQGSYLCVIMRHINEIVELERRVNLERILLSSVTEGIFGVDSNGLIRFINPAAARMLKNITNVIGYHKHDAIPHYKADNTPYRYDCPIMRTIRDGKRRQVTGEVFIISDGTHLPVEYIVSPTEENGEITGAVVSFQDITARLEGEKAAFAASATEQALRDLQQALQPPKPDLSNPALGVCYRPADDTTGAGGDLYDWQMLPCGELHLAVVDVVGKGLPAMRDALAVTHAIRMLSLAKTPLTDLVYQTDQLLTNAYPELAATTVIARYNPKTGLLKFVSGGHPPPLLLNPDGTHKYLEASGRALGWIEAGTDDVHEMIVPENGRVIFYTDGLIEAHRDLSQGMLDLAGLARQQSHLNAESLATHLVEAVLSGAARRDDCLALVLERLPS